MNLLSPYSLKSNDHDFVYRPPRHSGLARRAQIPKPMPCGHGSIPCLSFFFPSLFAQTTAPNSKRFLATASLIRPSVVRAAVGQGEAVAEAWQVEDTAKPMRGASASRCHAAGQLLALIRARRLSPWLHGRQQMWPCRLWSLAFVAFDGDASSSSQ